MPWVLVVVNPGCDAKTQEDVANLAWDLLSPHGHEEARWWGGHHHVFGRVNPAGHFSRSRLWSDFDDARGDQGKRKWHDGNILRDAWCLESGLLGPVRVVPLTEVTLPVPLPGQ